MTEIKYRGPLTDKQMVRLIEYLEFHGKLITSEFERVIFFDTSIFPLIGDFTSGFSRLSIKFDSKGMWLRMKVGNPSDVQRINKVIRIKKAHTENLLFVFNRLGLKYGYYRPAFRSEYYCLDFTIIVKKHCVMGNHFEIEPKKGKRIHQSLIKKFLKDLGLSLWRTQTYQRRITTLMEKFPPIDILESQLL